MMTFLIIVSLYGGIERVPMSSDATCKTAVEQFNTASRVATAICIRNAP